MRSALFYGLGAGANPLLSSGGSAGGFSPGHGGDIEAIIPWRKFWATPLNPGLAGHEHVHLPGEVQQAAELVQLFLR